MEEIINKLSEKLADEATQTRSLIVEELSKVTDLIQNLGVNLVKVAAKDQFERYETEEMLGEGAGGMVFRVIDSETQEHYALKNIYLEEKIMTSNVAREISTLLDVKHDNIVKLERVLQSDSEVWLIMEFVRDNLNAIIQEGKYREEEVKIWLKELLEAVNYLHSHDLIHRDLKPENILIDDNRRLKLADFGSVKKCFSNCEWTPGVVTLFFRAPEILLGSHSYGKQIDIWAIGCIFAEMADGKPLFGSAGDDEISIIQNIFRKLGTPKEGSFLFSLPYFPRDAPQYPVPEAEATKITSNLDALGNDLLMSMLEMDPMKRITAEDALNHPYFH